MKLSLLATVLLGAMLSHSALADVAAAHAPLRQPISLAANDTSNPYNSPIRRINPNSRQGTTEPNPQLRQPTPRTDNPRPPTLENRGIGNGNNLRRPADGTQQPRTAPGTR
ncbi:TolA-binding protein [Pseudomonas sp. PvP001]